MDDITSKISELLSDPQGINKIKQMASTLFSSDDNNDTKESSDNSSSDLLSGLLGSLTNNNNNPVLPDGFDPMKLMGLMSVLGRSGDDKRTALLLALKPHLSTERQQRVDKAIKFLKIAALLPVLREQGLLDIL